MTFKEFLSSKGISDEDFAAKSAEEVAGLFNEHNDNARKSLEEAVEAKASKEDIDSMKAELVANQVKQMDAINAVLKEHGIALSKMNAEEGPVKEKSIKDTLIEYKGALAKLKASGNANDNVKFEIKAAGDMSLAGNITGQIPQAFRIPGVNDVPSRRVRLLDIVSRGSVGSNLVEWVYKANKDGTAGPTVEGEAKNQIDFDLLVGSQKVEKITAYVTVTDEMLDDVEQMDSLIRTELNTELLKAVELGAYSGSGVSPQMNGVLTVATAFSAGAHAGAIDEANIVDVLAVAQEQIDIAQEGSAEVNYVMMHPTDITTLKTIKVTSSDRRYVERLAMVGANLMFDGIPIIPTTLVTQGDYLIGDFSKAFVWDKQAVTIEIGYNADNFVKNYKTIRAEWRGVTFVKNNDRTAFVTGTFATDITALETT